MIKRRDILALVALVVVPPAAGVAQDDFADGRIRYLEQGVTLQRGTESGAEEAATNVPFLPGDRVWTDGAGRAEFQFADGSVVRLDSRSKFDYVSHDQGSDERVVLRLWSGSLLLVTRDGRGVPDFNVETPGGLVDTRDRGVYRVDVADGEVRLSVQDGRASLDSGASQPVYVEAGERTYARGNEPPESPRRFDAAESDDFAQWNAARDGRDAWAGDTRRYVPEEVAPYASELESHGSWYYEAEVGYVWRPYVAPDWRPYTYGRWTWTLYGWTWVPYDSWGWAPFHYGRWGFSGALGWYWIPGRVWSPAWVSWAVGGDYVGWCPLGAGDRPIAFGNQSRGFAVARGTTNDSGWNYARRSDIESRDLARRRVGATPAVTRELRIADSPRARPTRDFRRVADVEAAAPRSTPRNINIKPTVGDYVPELHSDPATTIPVFARRPGVSRERYETRSQPGTSQSQPNTARSQPNATDRRRPGEATAAPRTPTPPTAHDERRHPTDVRYPNTRSAPPAHAPARGQDAPDRTDRSQPPREREVQPTDQRRSEPSTDREVLRNVFRPLSDAPRGGDVRSGAPRNSPTPPPRAEPRPRTQPPQRTPPPSPRATARPPKDQHQHN